MTTLVVGRNSGQVAIAADYAGDLRRHQPGPPLRGQQQDLQGRHAGRHELRRHGRHGGALSGAAQGHPAALPKDQLKLGSRDEVFDTFVKLHPLLKETFFLQTKEDDNDPYESSQFTVVIANASGIYGPATAKSSSSRNSGA